MNKIIRYFIYIVIIALAGFGFYKKVYLPKHTFKSVKPYKGSMDIVVNGIGNVGAKNIYKAGSVYGGEVLGFELNEGDYVEKGSLVATIDSVDLTDKIKEQETLKSKLLKDIEGLKIDKKSAAVNYKYQNEVYLKNKKLYKLHSISYLDYQKYFTAMESAKLNIESIKAHISSIKEQIKQIDAAIDGLKKRLQKYTIFSPVSGYVTKKLVVNHQTIMPNQTLFEVVNPKDVWVKAYIDTRVSGEVKIGDKATLQLRSSKKIYSAKVVSINPVNNPITYEREIDIKFDNLPVPFYLEEQASVKIEIKRVEDIIKIPANALSSYKGKSGVWIIKNDKVYFKAVSIVAYEDKTVGVRGISEDVSIAVPDNKKITLKNGMKIYHD